MPSFTPIGTDALVNTNTADGQISPRVVSLAGGKYMVIWVGSVVLPVVSVGGTFAAAYANADIRAQIYNADGTRSGGEIVINTTTAGAQLRPLVAQLSDGNILITWHDGVGPSGGSAETTPNTIRAQEFTSAGVASGVEFAIGSSNGRQHSVAPTPTGGFVVTYQEGGVGGALAAGNIVTRVYDANNVQTANIIVDNTLLTANINPAVSVVEADGDIIVYFMDREPNSNQILWRGSYYDASGNELYSGFFQSGFNVHGAVTLAMGGHAFIASINPGSGQPITIYTGVNSADGSLSEYVEIAQVPTLGGSPTVTALANGGFLASWIVDSDPGTAFNAEIMARAFNAIGDPIGAAFQVNTTTALNQSSPSFIQLTDGDIVGTWIDSSLLNGDASGTGIVMRRIDFDPINQNPVASNFAFSLPNNVAGTPIIIDPADFPGFFGPDGVDGDGDPLAIIAVGNVTNGTATLNLDGTMTLNSTAGATERLSFDYTVSDGQGGFATARATVTLPADFISLRPGETTLIDFLANDYYTPGPTSTGFTVSSSLRAELVNTASGQRIFFSPLVVNGTVLPVSEAPYFNLLVGQTAQTTIIYYNNEISVPIYVTLEGWTQQGGTVADNLVGDARPNHLAGGSGAANILTGGLGDDWYTVSVAGDVIVELVGQGNDSVRTQLPSFTLPDHVENLYFFGQHGPATGIGNAGDNVMATAGIEGVSLYGMAGNDTLRGGRGPAILEGGEGDDILDGRLRFFGVHTASYSGAVAGVQVDLRLTGPQNTLAAGFDTLIAIGNLTGSAFNDVLNGDGNDNVLDGGAGISFLYGHGGTDRMILRAGAAGSIIDGGAGYDILAINSTVTSLLGLAGIEAIELTGSNLTLTGTQFANGLAKTTAISGTGSITVNMDAGINFLSQSFAFAGGGVAVAVNGTTGIDIIKAGAGVHTINAGDGVDQIRGGTSADIINGGAGNDKIIGFTGADIITGGTGNDQFRYLFAGDSGVGAGADRITDYTIGGDRLNFALIDADAAAGGDQAFNFIGTGAFAATGIGQIRYANSGADLLVQADVNGDGIADMEIVLQGLNGGTLTAGDFIL